MKKFCLFLILTTLFSISSTFANAASAWQKYTNNPIINIGQQSWKSSHAWSPFVIKIDHAYQMWYAGYDGNYWRIGNASSTDGINWSDNVNNPIIDNSFINENVTEPTLIFHNGTYKMWYVSVNKQNNQSTIKYTTSNDGIHWSTSITVLTRIQGWEISYLAHPEISFLNNEYRIFYTGNSGSVWRIGYATSINGVNSWTRNNSPVLLPSGAWEKDVTFPVVLFSDGIYKMWYGTIGYNWISGPDRARAGYATSQEENLWIKNPDWVLRGNPESWDRGGVADRGMSILFKDGLYHLWYAGTDENPNWRIGYATSIDGISWTKQNGGNPVIEPTMPWELNNVSYPNVLFENGKYKMWYAAGYGDLPHRIVYAESSDGINWNKPADQNPVITSTGQGFDSRNIASPFVIREGNQYKMWYSGLSGSWSIGYATMSAEINLNVPLLKQTQEPWHLQTYDLANLWNPSDPTIHAWGCALTSAAMILQYHGFNKLPNDTILNPGTLNTWLNSQSDGYIGNGLINWLAVSRLSKLAKNINGITAFDALEYNRKNGEDKSLLTSDLNNSQPDILEEPGHFIVAKGINGGTFNINDPAYDRLTLNDGYSNSFLSLGRYVPSSTDLSYILLVTDENLEITLKDSNGNALGEQFIQQPIASYNNPSQTNGPPLKMFYLPKPQSGEYSLTLTAPGEKLYNLEIYLYDEDGNVNILSVDGIAGQSQTENLIINFDNKNSQNSKTEKIPTFQSTIEDIKEGQRLRLIQNDIADTLIDLLKMAQKDAGKGRKKLALMELNAAKTLLNKIYKSSKGILIKENLYQILIYDLNYLKTHL